MSFNSLTFLIFLPVVLLGYWLLPQKFRWIWLLVASYAFYLSWNIELIFLIVGTTLVSYLGGLFIEKVESKKAKKWIMISAITICLAVLFVFKYFDFMLETVYYFVRLGNPNFEGTLLNLILPIGISFYTFQTLSYVVDVYRGTIKAEKHLGYYALFVSFFPQLVAGPIERPENLIPQLKEEHHINATDFQMGMRYLLSGFIKKIVIADTVAIIVDCVYAKYADANGLALYLGSLLFFVQIYCDFSGYSDIATGCARLMGIKLMKNFGDVFHSSSLQELWANWHISLGTWFNDYVYTPLNYKAMNRKHIKLWMFVNLFIVMLLSGLWHGANWTFVLWGLFIAIVLTLEKLLSTPVRKWAKKHHFNLKATWYLTIKRLFVFLLISMSIILFRSQSIEQAFTIISKIFTQFLNGGINNTITYTDLTREKAIVTLLVCLFVPFLPKLVEEKPFNKEDKLFTLKNVTFAIGVVVICFAWFALISGNAESSFVYFQF